MSFSIPRLAFVLAACAAVALGQSSNPVPPAPTSLEASDGAYAKKVGLSWDHVRNGASYRVLRSETNDSAAAIELGSTPSIIFYDRTATPGQVYFYWVQAENDASASPLSSPDQGFRAVGITNAFGPIAPLEPPPAPVGNPVTGAKVYLGKTLFWDEQLSSTRTIACGTCHLPRNGGSDPRSVIGSPRALHPGVDGVFNTMDDIVGSPGVPLSLADGSYVWSPEFGFEDQVTRRKAQSTIDSGYSDVGLFWDGRAGPKFRDPLTGELVFPDAPPLESQALESQALGPLLSDVEMAHQERNWSDVTERIAASRPLAPAASVPPAIAAWIVGRDYPSLFAEAFGTPEITPVRIAMAIASYERTLYSDRARIDRIVSQIEDEPVDIARGRELFFGNFCDECHRGSLMSDNRFRFVGIRPDDEDLGRAEVPGQAEKRGWFRTPTLRNSALRAPYMHTGSLASLEDVVDFYNRGGDFESASNDNAFVRPLKLTVQQRSDMVAFLSALNDPRAEAEAGPLFDRPLLYSESARVPRVVGEGTPGAGGFTPQVKAIEPPMIGNPSFTVGLFGALGGAEAVLVIDEADSGDSPEIPAAASFAHMRTRVEGVGPGAGYASLSLAIPDDEALIGRTLFGRWFVEELGGVATSPTFQVTIFGPAASKPPDVSVFSSVSAASLAIGSAAPESIVSGFGSGLAVTTESPSSLPLPTALAGVRVLVRDSLDEERAAALFFVSAGQINYQIPPGTALGEAVATVDANGVTVARGTVQIASVAPALFAANSNGRGPAAANALHVAPDDSQTIEPVARFDAVQERFLTAPIDLGQQDDRVFLVLFGSGVRGRSGAAVTVRIGGETIEAAFAGAQTEFVGVDQINVLVPRSLAGRGEVDVVVTVDGQASNRVTAAFQ